MNVTVVGDVFVAKPTAVFAKFKIDPSARLTNVNNCLNVSPVIDVFNGPSN